MNTPTEQVNEICTKIGGLHPDPAISDWDWAHWLTGFGGIPAREVCPKCGEGHLVERKGKHGAFVGCSEYPSCRYTARS